MGKGVAVQPKKVDGRVAAVRNLFRQLHSIDRKRRERNGHLTSESKQELDEIAQSVQADITVATGLSDGEIHCALLTMNRGEGALDGLLARRLST